MGFAVPEPLGGPLFRFNLTGNRNRIAVDDPRLETTVHAKARVYVGSDVQLRVDYQSQTPDGLDVPLTRVVRYPAAGALS